MSVLEIPSAPVVVRDGGLVLRAFTPADLPDLVAAFADATLASWNPGPVESEEAALDWLRHRADWSGGDHLSWAVSDADGALHGSVSLFHLDRDQGDGEVGYWLTPAARGRGVAAHAVRTAAAYALGQLGFHRLFLFHAIENEASCRVAEASGFRLEGTLRESHRYGDGAYHDEHIHGRLATDAVQAEASTA